MTTAETEVQQLRQRLRALKRDGRQVDRKISSVKIRQDFLEKLEAKVTVNPNWRPTREELDTFIGTFKVETDPDELEVLEFARKMRRAMFGDPDDNARGVRVERGTELENLGPSDVVSIRTEGVVRRFVILHPAMQTDGADNDADLFPVLVGRWVEHLRLRRGPILGPAVKLEQAYTFRDGTVVQPGRTMAIDPRAAVYRESDGRQVYTPRTNQAIPDHFRQWLKQHPAWPPKRMPIMHASAPPEVEHVSVELGPYTHALEVQIATREMMRQVAKMIGVNPTLSLVGGNKRVVKGLGGVMSVQVAESLETAATYFVRDEIVALNEADVASVPDDTIFHMDELPSRDGFMYLEDMVSMACRMPERHVTASQHVEKDTTSMLGGPSFERPLHTQNFHEMRAISWMAVDAARQRGTVDWIVDGRVSEANIQVGPNVDPRFADLMSSLAPDLTEEQRNRLNESDFCAIVLYSEMGVQPLRPSELFMLVDGQLLSHGSALDAGGPSDLQIPIKFFVALLSFMREKLAITTDRQPNSLLRKRLEREAKQYQPIRVIHLRARPSAESNGHVPAETGRKFQYRFPVRSHIRNQWYPSMGKKDDPKARRLIRIRASVKGPVGAEFVSRKRVFAVVR